MPTNRRISRIILVRHGRSTFNDQGRYQGSSDQSVLTLKGIQTAKQVGIYLRSISLDGVYTSPLLRAKQTTNRILKAMELKSPIPIRVSSYLREIDLSVWEGLSYENVRQHHKEAYHRWQHFPETFQLPQTDNSYYFPVNDLYKRAHKFWDHSLSQNSGKTILVVSHGGTNHALISTALGLSPQHHHCLQQSNCGISVLQFCGTDTSLLRLNYTSPIQEVLPKLKAGKGGLRLLLLAIDHLTLTTCEQLAQRLANIKLDFCFSTASGEQYLPGLLQYHSNTAKFIDEGVDFLQYYQQDWPDSLCTKQGLITGIAIAPTTTIQTLLSDTLGGHSSESTKICIKSGHLSVIHYPKNHRPIVQGINI